jgi:aminoglycoside phosphotransferase (APT) family kinase protein
MSPIPGSDRHLDADVVRALLRDQFPHLASQPVAYLAEGYDHQMYEVGEWLFRFPKRASVVRWFEREVRVMPSIAAVIGVPVPRFEHIGRPSETFPYPFAGYRRIPGVGGDDVDELDVDAVAASLGVALTRLHALDPALVPPDPEEDGHAPAPSRDALDRLPAAIRDVAMSYLTAAEPSVPLPRVIHSDLLPEHILIDPATGRLAGIIDFADMWVGDPASDFAGLAALGGWDLVRKTIAAYELGVDDSFVERVVWRTRRLHLGWFVNDGDEDEEHLKLVIDAFSEESLLARS